VFDGNEDGSGTPPGLALSRLLRFQWIIESCGMETLADLEAFVRSAECGSFSKAARRLLACPLKSGPP